MAIKFNCPQCKKEFIVKDNLAGLRRACPACKKMLTVPAPNSAPANVEEFAAAALADKPEEAAPVKEAESIEFVCSYCDTKVAVAADLAGKQTSCPECRRIVKVPLPKKADPKDWRKVDSRLPAGARRDVEPAPEGAWDARAVGTVSREALLEADAVPQVKPKRTWKQWTRIGVTAGAFAGVVALIVLFILNYRASTLHARLLALALDGLEDSKDKLAAAELFRAAGEYQLRAQTPNASAASILFGQAHRAATLPANLAHRYEPDCLLIDLLRSEVNLGSSESAEIALREIQDNKRIKWDPDAQRLMNQTFQNLRVPEARAEALLLITRELADRHQDKRRSRPWASQFPDQTPDLLAELGLEILRTSKDPKEIAEAKDLAGQASQPFQPHPPANPAEPQKKKPPLPASLIALWVVLDQQEQAQKLIGTSEPGKPVDPAVVLGLADGFARKGEWEQANQALEHALQANQLPVLVALAAVALDTRDLGKAIGYLQKAFAAAASDPKLQELSPWLLYRLVRLGVKAGMEDEAVALAKKISDGDLRGRAQLAILNERLDKLSQVVDEGPLQIVDKDTPAHGLALEAWARHNARWGGTAVQKSVDAWPSETDRRFGYLGLLLGLRDADQH
jgi:hypothetical protein